MPVPGALVWDDGFWGGPLAGMRSATADTDGHFAISDLPPFDEPKRALQLGKRVVAPATIHRLLVRHPDFAERRHEYSRVPGMLNITLEHGGGIRGRVVDAVTGKPVPAVRVEIQATKQSSRAADHRGWRETQTNVEGEYEFSRLPPAEYNVWAHDADRTCAALDSVPVVAGAVCQAADLELVEGGWLEGRVSTIRGQPISHDPETGSRLHVALNGPSRPRSGTRFESCLVDDEGRFRLRVAPGRNFPYLAAPEVWQRTWRLEKFERGVSVESGRTVAINFRLLDRPAYLTPPPRPERDPVKLPPATAAERDAAETIRDLGGWYQLDKEGHVVEINMVYHEEGGVRNDNNYTDSDEALRIAPAFPRLTRLYLHKRQATDESLKYLIDLKGLQTFFIWDATAITDVGARHLAHLENLENIHLGSSQMGDAALEALSRLPKLSRMSLQKNAFNDAGLAHLAEMRCLRALWIGMSKGKITDAGLAHLSGLEDLEELDVQQSQITDAGLEHLKGLRNLRSLYLSTAPVTAEGLAGLREALPNLNVHK
jgi:hypothetical protein